MAAGCAQGAVGKVADLFSSRTHPGALPPGFSDKGMIRAFPLSRLAQGRRSLLALLATSPVLPALAQFRVEVSGVGITRIPIAIPTFRGEASAPQQIAAIVRANLERSGRFHIIDGAGADLDETSRPDLAHWRARDAGNLAPGSISRLADGRYDVRFRLWDIVDGQDLGGQSYTVPQADLRLTAHKIADYIYQRLTGERGVFATRVSYITKNGNRYTLWVADADGENAQPALTSPEPIISPAWSPDGRRLAYVSFEARKPVVYVHEVATGRRRLLANFRGSNSAPAWSPDSQTIALTLSQAGGSQLFVMSANGGTPRRLTTSNSIDTEPAFAPDGRSIYFVSDRGGSPQIYRMSASGGSAERVTYGTGYAISPSPSPDGRWLAFIGRTGRGYQLQVMPTGGGSATTLTSTGADEKPSFSPNSQLIVYATREGGRDVLMTTTLDGKIKTRLAGKAGDIREPSWAPFH